MKMIKSIVLLFVVLIAATAIVSLMVGTPFLSGNQLIQVITGTGKPVEQLIVSEFRMPRLLISLIAGACLGVSGYLLQGVTRNELADSSILGINAGAGFFVMLYLGFFAQNINALLLPFIAFMGGIVASALVYMTARKRSGQLGMNRLLLAGIAVNAGLSALTLLCTIQLSKENYGFVNAWLAGSIWGSSWSNVWSLVPWAVVLLPIAFLYNRKIPVLSFGQERAQSLGINIPRNQKILLAAAVALACGSVAVAGSLSFVGLLSPHAAKLIVKKENTWTCLLSALIGALLVNIADVGARLLMPSGEIPTGILIALIGAPYFLYLLFARQKNIFH